MVKDSLLVRLSKYAVLFSIGFIDFSGQAAHAADDALGYFKNYFVTGDYVLGGVGNMRGTGSFSESLDGSFATGTINISRVPCTKTGAIVPCTTPGSAPSGIVAAFLCWQTDEPVSAVNPSPSRALLFARAALSSGLSLFQRYSDLASMVHSQLRDYL